MRYYNFFSYIGCIFTKLSKSEWKRIGEEVFIFQQKLLLLDQIHYRRIMYRGVQVLMSWQTLGPLPSWCATLARCLPGINDKSTNRTSCLPAF